MSVAFAGTRADLVRLIRQVAAAAGGGADPLGVARPILLLGAVSLLSSIQTAFVAKARGGVGSDGIKWKPLTRATIAGRRTTKAELRALGAGGRRVRGLLTPAEDAKWRAVFRSTLAQLRARGVGNAEGLAAQRAWAVLKAQGAKTRLGTLGGRTVEIGRDTGQLLRSLTPGTGDAPARTAGQVAEVGPGRITVGSSVPHAAHFHKARPLWPADLPPAWGEAACEAIARGLVREIARAATGGR